MAKCQIEEPQTNANSAYVCALFAVVARVSPTAMPPARVGTPALQAVSRHPRKRVTRREPTLKRLNDRRFDPYRVGRFGLSGKESHV